MQWNKKTKGFLALILSLMILVSGFPTIASSEISMEDYPETEIEQTAEPVADLEDAPPLPVPDTHEITESFPDLDVESEPLPDDSADSVDTDDSIRNAILANGHAYVMAMGNVMIYDTAEMTEHIFTITQADAVLLATQYIEQWDRGFETGHVHEKRNK